MKKSILAMAVIFGGLALTACQSTSSSPSPANSTLACGSAGTAYVNGQWVNTSNNQPINCANGNVGGSYGYGGYGTPGYGTGTVAGCTYWNNVAQAQGLYWYYYVPFIDPGTMQPVCVNIGQNNYAYLQQAGYTGYSPIYYQDQYYSGYGYGGGYYNDYSSSSICIGGGSAGLFGGACFTF